MKIENIRLHKTNNYDQEFSINVFNMFLIIRLVFGLVEGRVALNSSRKQLHGKNSCRIVNN